jgi:hexosaminidase
MKEAAMNIIPKPLKTELIGGAFTLNPSTVIIRPDNSDEIQWLCNDLAQRLRQATGYALPISDSQHDAIPRDAILLTRTGADPSLGNEGYELTVQPESVTLTASKPAGLFYAAQSLLQLFSPEIKNAQQTHQQRDWRIPCLRISDRPRFPWRGFMLDSCRHIQSVAFIEHLLDLLAYYKMNRFHWHLTEDQAWRLEISKYPRLTEIAAWRNTGEQRYGGFFTKDQVRHIIEYGRQRYVTVYPEIEMPGHATAGLYAYPELTCSGKPFPAGENGLHYYCCDKKGAGPQIFCAGRKETFRFLENVLTEVFELFDAPFIHIGGDERRRGIWSECSRCQQVIRQHGLRDEDHLQNWFMDQIASFVRTNDHRTIAWAENLKDGVPDNQIAQGWHEGETAKAAKMGFESINSDHSFTYLSYHWSEESKRQKPDGYGPILELEKVYSFDPIPDGLTNEQAARVIGSEAPIWTERVPDDTTAYEYIFPRLLAFSEVIWSPQHARQFSEFQPRLRDHIHRLKLMGVPCGE